MNEYIYDGFASAINFAIDLGYDCPDGIGSFGVEDCKLEQIERGALEYIKDSGYLVLGA